MANFTRRTLTGAMFAAGLLLAACGGGSGDSAARSAFEREGDKAKGSAEAPVTIVEYASVACGACATWHQLAYPTVKEYVDSGDVRLVFREMITGQPTLAIAGFMLARCAPEDRYFDTIDILFEQQRALFNAMSTGQAQTQMNAIANSVGVSDTEFRACMNDDTLLQDVREANEAAVEAGVNATPTFLINGKRLETQGSGEDGVWTWGGKVLEDDEGPIPANFKGDTFERIILHFKTREES